MKTREEIDQIRETKREELQLRVSTNTDAVEKLCQSLKADSQQRPLRFWSKALSCYVDNYSSFERMKKSSWFFEIVF